MFASSTKATEDLLSTDHATRYAAMHARDSWFEKANVRPEKHVLFSQLSRADVDVAISFINYRLKQCF
jgi:hypothetical protein